MAIFQDSVLGQLLKKIFIVLMLGGVCAVLVAGLVLYYFKPMSGPSADSILPYPSAVEDLSFTEQNIRYVFDHVEFLYPNEATNEWEKFDINPDQYEQIFEMLSNATSLLDAPDHVRSFFDWDEPAKLTLFARREGSDGLSKEPVPFQEVQFLTTDDYFRIQVRGDGQEANWAYFYYPNIYNMVLKVLVPQQ